MIDISAVQYDVELMTEDGTRYLINAALLNLQWEEQINELAQRATITVANAQIGDTYIIEMAKINCVILIYGKWGEGDKTLLFEGTIWEWQYVSSTNKELTITAYDRLIRLQQSKDFYYFAPGMTTQAIVGKICNDHNIPFSYDWSRSVTHEKKLWSAIAVSVAIIDLLEEVRRQTGEKYVIYWRDGQLQITGRGNNSTVYLFDTQNVISTMNKLTINNLVTEVRILGNEDRDQRRPVDDTVPGDQQYGILREIILRDRNKTLATAQAEAKTIIKERGKPEEIIQINVPDLPFMRKGDKVEVSAGNLIGFFFVAGISHYATNRQMMLILERDMGKT